LKTLHDGVPRDSREFLDLELALHRELALRPWHDFVFDLGADDDAEGLDLDSMRGQQRAHVLDLLRQLRAAIAADDAPQPWEATLASPSQ
jgi:hypothetical protein